MGGEPGVEKQPGALQVKRARGMGAGAVGGGRGVVICWAFAPRSASFEPLWPKQSSGH